MSQQNSDDSHTDEDMEPDRSEAVARKVHEEAFFSQLSTLMLKCVTQGDNFDAAYAKYVEEGYIGPTPKWIELKTSFRSWKEGIVTEFLAESTKFPNGLVRIIAGYWDERVTHYRIKKTEWGSHASSHDDSGFWVMIGLHNWTSPSEIRKYMTDNRQEIKDELEEIDEVYANAEHLAKDASIAAMDASIDGLEDDLNSCVKKGFMEVTLL